MIKAVQLKSVEAFKILVNNYDKSYSRDPSFKIVKIQIYHLNLLINLF